MLDWCDSKQLTKLNAWCNEAGDIANSFWNYENFDRAPFHDKFAWIN